MNRDTEIILGKLLQDLDTLVPEMEFYRPQRHKQGIVWLTKHHVNGAESSSRGTQYQSWVTEKGYINGWNDDSLSIIDWYAYMKLGGVPYRDDTNFTKLKKYFDLSFDEKRQITANNAVLKANKTLKLKESIKVHLTRNKAEFRYLFTNGFFLNFKGYCFMQSWDNTLVQYLATLFDTDILSSVLRRYMVMTTRERVMWLFVDADYKLASIKRMKYLSNGHRDKEDNYSIQTDKACSLAISGANTIVKRERQAYEDAEDMLFGQQFDREGVSHVYVVESEKSAIMLKCFLLEHGRQDEVLAIGGKGQIEKMTCIKQAKSVSYLPDLKKTCTLAMLQDADLISHAFDIAEIDSKLVDTLAILQSRGIDAKLELDFFQTSSHLLTDELLKTGLDIADIIEIAKTSASRQQVNTSEASEKQAKVEARTKHDTSMISEEYDFGIIPPIVLQEHNFVSLSIIAHFKALCGVNNVELTEVINQPNQAYKTIYLRVFLDEYILEWSFVYNSIMWEVASTRSHALQSLRSFYQECRFFLS